jgi:Tfp pilus assembly protein PilF
MKKSTCYLLILLTFSFGTIQAQQRNIQDALMALKNGELAIAKNSIDEAAKNETTKNSTDMYYAKAMVYLNICANQNEQIKSIDENAAYISAEAFYLFFSSEESKKKAYVKEATSKLFVAGIHTNNQGIDLLNNGNPEKAYKYFELVRKLTKYDTDEKMKEYSVTENSAILSMQLAAEKSGNNELARKHLKELIANNYDDPNLYIFLFNSFMSENKEKEALNAIGEGIKKYPRDKNLLITEMNYYIDKGETSVLMDKFNKLIEADDRNPDYYFYRGTLYHQDKQFENAEKDYLKALEIDQFNYDVKFNLGVLYIDQSNPIREERNKNLSNINKYLDLEDQMYSYYLKALPYFEEVYNANALKSNDEKIQLLEIMRETYKHQKKVEKVKQLSQELDKLRSES